MKKTTEEMLYNELRSKKYGYGMLKKNQKPLCVLFEKYLEAEVDSVDRFIDMFKLEHPSDSEYCRFLERYKKYIKISRNYIKQFRYNKEELLSIGIGRNVGELMGRCSKRDIARTQQFVDIVNGVVEYTSILDVGSSAKIPVSSLMLAKGSGKVTSMDQFSDYWLSTKVFDNLNIDIKSGLFDNDTDISGYDAIVGASPCSAITPIVQQCATADNTTYLVKMCDCCSPMGVMTGFVEYLKKKDDRLRAFVVGTDIDTSKKDIYAATNGQNLDSCDIMDVYISNSDKHSDDILDVLYRATTRGM